MPDTEPVIAVVGPGAVGGLLAWLLQRAGADVVIVGRAASVEAINSQGLRVTSGLFGEGTEFVSARETVPDGASVVLAVKTFGLDDSLKLIARSTPLDVLSLMNGIGHREVLGAGLEGIPVAAGSIAVESIRTEDRGIEHKSPFLRLAVPSSAAEFTSVRTLAKTPAELTVGGTDAEVLWRKFRFLAPMALLTSYWQTGLGEALDRDPALTQALLADVVACEATDGVHDTVESLATTLAAFPATMRTSLQADLAVGNPSELDSIGGVLLRQAERHDVAVPALEKVVAKLSESG
ncbi:ketopantoate reductase family protein [Microbacterium sp. AK031]|uniref:ketopantoate reductase family protein n=1 Tax=Microbacterium sp. AK031 TaxID=2723076 RepID=UPI002168B078|nr:2-dehydropantoate 2-reductase N-terminal domain-containing protein [Microbacterium sp. AK031]MCS3843884.1 2-dehydropantoate 2-reductase [Microbacterium sp. AK031]